MLKLWGVLETLRSYYFSTPSTIIVRTLEFRAGPIELISTTANLLSATLYAFLTDTIPSKFASTSSVATPLPGYHLHPSAPLSPVSPTPYVHLPYQTVKINTIYPP